MTKFETITNDQMNETSRSCTSVFGLSHSFVIRHSCFVICLLIFTTSPAFAQKRNITEKDLFDFVWIGDPQVSPDGARVAFVRVIVNEKKEGYNTSIWSVPIAGGEEPHQLTKGDHDGSPRWSPDGKYLLFVRATEKDGKPEPPQLSILPMAGGDSFSFTDLPKGAGDPKWSPDGKQIAFTSSTNPDDLEKQEKKKKKEEELKKAVSAEGSASPGASASASAKPATGFPSPTKPAAKPADAAVAKAESEAEHESDVRVITRAVYREDNDGYADPKHPSHIWVVNAPKTADEKVEPKQITSGRFDEGGVVWAKDNSRIYFASLHVDEPYYELPKTELYSISPTGGEATKITTFDMDIGDMSLSPDGKQISFVAATSQPVNSYTQPDLWVVDLTPNAKPRNLTADFDFDVGAGVFGDNGPPRAGGGNAPVWMPDGRSIIEIYGKEGRTILASFDVASGKPTDLTKGNQAVGRFRASDDRSKLIYTVSTATRIGDLFTIDSTGGEPRELTHINNGLFSKFNLTEP